MSVKNKPNSLVNFEKLPPLPPCQFKKKMAAAAILFSMDSSQNLIRSSEITRQQPEQI